MEKSTKLFGQDKNSQKTKPANLPKDPHEINLKDRNILKMTGIIEVVSATPSTITTKTEYGGLLILGSDLRVNLLDIESKVVEIVGDINELKYQNHKKSFLQRLFK